jgi:hypothetical protein
LSAGPTDGAGGAGSMRPFDVQAAALVDRRGLGMFDARYHSTSRLAGSAAGPPATSPPVVLTCRTSAKYS